MSSIMDLEQLDPLKESIRKLSAKEQDHLASFLLMERLKRNTLNMKALHQRVEDADPENWEPWAKTKETLKDD